MQRAAKYVRRPVGRFTPDLELVFVETSQPNGQICQHTGSLHNLSVENRLALVLVARAFVIFENHGGWDLVCHEEFFEVLFGEKALRKSFECEKERRLVVGLRAAGLCLSGDETKQHNGYRAVDLQNGEEDRFQNQDTIFEKIALVCAVAGRSTGHEFVRTHYYWDDELPKRKRVAVVRDDLNSSLQIVEKMTAVIKGELAGSPNVAIETSSLPERVGRLTHSSYVRHQIERPTGWEKY